MSSTGAVPSIVEVVRVMNNHFGGILIEAMSGATHADLARWIEGGVPDIEQEARLRIGHTVFTMVSDRKGSDAALKLMLKPSPHLEQGYMIDAIRESRYEEVIQAMGAHLGRELG